MKSSALYAAGLVVVFSVFIFTLSSHTSFEKGDNKALSSKDTRQSGREVTLNNLSSQHEEREGKELTRLSEIMRKDNTQRGSSTDYKEDSQASRGTKEDYKATSSYKNEKKLFENNSRIGSTSTEAVSSVGSKEHAEELQENQAATGTASRVLGDTVLAKEGSGESQKNPSKDSRASREKQTHNAELDNKEGTPVSSSSLDSGNREEGEVSENEQPSLFAVTKNTQPQSQDRSGVESSSQTQEQIEERQSQYEIATSSVSQEEVSSENREEHTFERPRSTTTSSPSSSLNEEPAARAQRSASFGQPLATPVASQKRLNEGREAVSVHDQTSEENNEEETGSVESVASTSTQETEVLSQSEGGMGEDVVPENEGVELDKEDVFIKTNEERQSEDLSPLTRASLLDDIATIRLEDMFEEQYFAHNSPAGESASSLAQDKGYEFLNIAENIILGNFESVQEIMQKWMESPGHRKNILGGAYEELGVALKKGLYKGKEMWIGVQVFGRSQAACERPSEELKRRIEEMNEGIQNLGSTEEAERLSQEVEGPVTEYNAQVETYNTCLEG